MGYHGVAICECVDNDVVVGYLKKGTDGSRRVLLTGRPLADFSKLWTERWRRALKEVLALAF